MAPTSGTVATYTFTQRGFLEQALRRAGYNPEEVGSESLRVAQDELFMQLSEYTNSGFPLWTREFDLLGMTPGSPEVAMPFGTVDILHAYWRILNPYRGPATMIGGGDASVLFAGQPNADLTIAGPNPYVQVNFGSPTEIDTIGILPGGAIGPFLHDGSNNLVLDGNGTVIQTGTYPAIVNTPYLTVSTDGNTWFPPDPPVLLSQQTFDPGQWTYYNVDPSITAQYLRLFWPCPPNTSWLVNQLQFALSQGEDIEIGPLNIDDYYNLPNKQFQSDRVVSAYDDRKINAPVLKLWPVPNVSASYNGLISVLRRRYIQDPGAMTDNIEVPIRWYNGVVSRLGVRLMDVLPDPQQNSQASYFSLMAKQQRRQNLEQTATKAEAMMWAEERVAAPIRWMPNISVYTK